MYLNEFNNNGDDYYFGILYCYLIYYFLFEELCK